MDWSSTESPKKARGGPSKKNGNVAGKPSGISEQTERESARWPVRALDGERGDVVLN